MAAGYEGFPSTLFQAEKEQAEPEKEAAILKAKAEAGEEEASLKAKAENEASLIVKAGRGSKRKAEEDLEEAPAAVGVMVAWNGADDSEDEFCKACMVDDDYDSDDDLDVCAAKIKASFERSIEICYARYPWLVGKGKVADADADGA